MANKLRNPAVRARGLTVVRGGRTVLDGLDFDIPRGRVTGLLGPSGCGKSTLLRAIAGTQAKVTGTLDVLDRPAGTPSLRSRIGYCTQAPSVYADLTVRQNLAYFAAVLGSRTADGVERALADVDLTDHADRLVAQPLRRPALAGLARGRPARRARTPRPRRTHRRPRPGAPPRPLEPLPPDRRRRRHPPRLVPRHGRGRTLRPAAAHALRAPPRRRHARSTPRPAPARRRSRRPSSDWSTSAAALEESR